MKTPVDPLASIHGQLSKQRASEVFAFLKGAEHFTLGGLLHAVLAEPKKYPALHSRVKTHPPIDVLVERYNRAKLGAAINSVKEHLKNDPNPTRLYKVFESVKLEDGAWGRMIFKVAVKDEYYRSQLLARRAGDEEAATKRNLNTVDYVVIVNGKLPSSKKSKK